MKRIILSAAAAAMFLTSCTQDNIKETGRGLAIDFRTAIGTRAEVLTESNLSSFFVTALTEDGEAYFTGTEFKRNDTYYTSETKYYWPSSGNLHFYAYYPSATTMGVTITIDGEDKILTGYTPPQDITEQIDFVAGSAVGNKEDNETNGVSLELKHQLSQIEIKGLNTNTAYTYSVKGIRIKNVAARGDFDFALSRWIPDYDVTTSYEVTYDAARTLSGIALSLMKADEENADEYENAMLIPQTVTQWETSDKTNEAGGSYIAVLIQVNAASGSRVFPSETAKEDYEWVAVPMGFDWESGYKYTYTLDFSAGAGKVDPEKEADEDDPYKPGEDVLGGKMTFNISFSTWTYMNENLSASE